MSDFDKKQWDSWKEDPMTQLFFEYIRQKRFDVTRFRLGLLDECAASELPIEGLARAAGISAVLRDLQNLTFEGLTESLQGYKDVMANTRKMLQEQLGVNL